MAKISNRQRGLWMVLITSLAAPFFASLAVVALSLVGALFDLTFVAGGGTSLGATGMAAFAWSAIPSTIGAIGLLPYVLESGSYGWLNAAVAGVLAFGAAAIIAPIGAGPAMPFLAFLSGIIGIGMRVMLIRGGILKS